MTGPAWGVKPAPTLISLGLACLLRGGGAVAWAQAPAPIPPPEGSAPAAAAPAAGSEAPPPAEKKPFLLRAQQTIISGEELHRWDRYVRGFRREHNFALSSGVSSGTWDVRRFGTLKHVKVDDTGVFTRFQYSFHLPLYEGFGFFLGSSFGYHYESVDRRKTFKPVPAYMFPGVLAGLVLNINPVVRWLIGADAYLERHNGIQDRDGIPEDPTISVTMQAYDFGTFVDVFYDLSWALRIEAHRRHLEYLAPKRPDSGQVFPVDANIKKDDQWLGVGLVYHLL